MLLLAFATGLEFTPGTERWRLFRRVLPAPAEAAPLLDPAAQHEGTSQLQTDTRTRTELAQPESVELPPLKSAGPTLASDDFVVPRVDAEAPPVPLEDPQHSLDDFYRALDQTLRAQGKQGALAALTRITYFGDSLVASDYVTGTLRRKFHDQFGDGGHGFVLMADAWPSYFHNDVFRFASRGFEVSRIVGPYTADGLYGLGGVSFLAPPGVRARFGTAEEGSYGRKVSRFRVLYLKQPAGGSLQINLDGNPHSTIETAAPEKSSGVFELQTSDGAHMLEVVTKSLMTRTFGVILERDTSGVVLDAIGIQGARVRFLDKQDDTHWAEQLKLRDSNLLVYEFGANESGDGFAYSMPDFHETMKAVLLQGQRALPKAGCLVLSAMDRARKENDVLVSLPIMPHIVREQEATAKELGCAFFDVYEAMGGKGSMAKWFRRGLGQADFTHPTGYGAQVLGNWVYQALMQGFEDWRTRQSAPAVQEPPPNPSAQQ